MRVAFLFVAAGVALAQNPYRGTIFSENTRGAVELTADPDSAPWKGIEPSIIRADTVGHPAPDGYRTEVRSRWDGENLHFLFTCQFDNITMNPSPAPAVENRHLWDWDYAELMVGTDLANIGNYLEFGVSPQEEWYDFRRGKPEPSGFPWSSGGRVKSRLDRDHKVWYAEISIPLKAIDPDPVEPGKTYRVNLYRVPYLAPKEALYLSWRPTGSAEDFNVPKAFGTLVFK